MSMTLDATRTYRFDDPPETNWPKVEVLDGGVFMTPYPTTWHQDVVTRLTVALVAAASLEEYMILPGANVSPNDGQDGLIPDVAVLRRQNALYVHPRDVLLVVEVESPSTGRNDRMVKPSVYAEWGIPNFWRVTDAGATIQVLRDGAYVDARPEGWLNIDLSHVTG